MDQQILGAVVLSCLFQVGALTSAQAGDALLLEDQQLDVITAGGSAEFVFDATASSQYQATTVADGTAVTFLAATPGQPHYQAEVSVAQGHANATALGEDPTVSSSVSPTSMTTSGPAVYTSSFGMSILTPYAAYSMGFSYSATTTTNPFALLR